MKCLEYSDQEQWSARSNWFEDLLERNSEHGSHLIGEHASALTAQVQACFCSGAWVAVIILAFSVIESNFREVDQLPRNARPTEFLRHFGEGVASLRKARNQLLHGNGDTPILTVDHLWYVDAGLEAEARKAVQLMIACLFSNPGT